MTGVESRETRASAAEVKFLVDAATGARIREWARAHMQPDPYGSGPFADEYHTSTLYFDTDGLDVFHRRRSYGRAKYRVRRYSTTDYVFLERKLRRPRLVVKRRTRADLETLDLRQPESLNGHGRWFFDRLAIRRLQPACVVSYDRTARALAADTGPLRLTLDDNVQVRPASGFSLATTPGDPVLADQTILELKFRGTLPAHFRRLVETFLLQPGAASKYRLGMAALGHEALPAPRSADDDPELLTE